MNECPICESYEGLIKDFPKSIRFKEEYKKHKENSHNGDK